MTNLSMAIENVRVLAIGNARVFGLARFGRSAPYTGQTENPRGSHDTVSPAASGSPPLRPATGWITFESSVWRRIR